MRGIFKLAVATAMALLTQSLAAPVVVTPGGEGEVIVTEDNTVNGTQFPHMRETAVQNPLRISLKNNLGGGQAYAYVTGLDTTGAAVMLSPSGNWYYPDPAGSKVPIAVGADNGIALGAQGQSKTITLPDYLISGRVYVSVGKLKFFTVVAGDGRRTLVEPAAVNPNDPSAGINWGFVELTNTKDGGIFANISYVDFIGLVMGMSLTLGSGQVQTVKGLKQGSVDAICQKMKTQATIDGQPWDQMCVTDSTGKALRVLSPNLFLSVGTNKDKMTNYYTDYVNKVVSTNFVLHQSLILTYLTDHNHSGPSTLPKISPSTLRPPPVRWPAALVATS